MVITSQRQIIGEIWDTIHTHVGYFEWTGWDGTYQEWKGGVYELFQGGL
jgi:hypothetical protein